jgi:sugar/nucleoside kinase (ribokinase family)
MSLLVVGSVAFDAIETPFGKTDKIVGGAASYIALSSSYLCENVNLVAVVGGDFPKKYIQNFKDHGINTDGLQIKEDQKSFFWSGKYHDNMNKRDTLVTELNVLADFDPIIPEAYQNCDYLMLGNLAPALQSLVVDRMTKRPKLVLMDTMNFWMDIAMDDLKIAISKVDVLTVNDEEARQLTGEYHLTKAAKAIMQMGPKHVIIKKGEHGAFLFHQDGTFYAPALPLEEVCDPTGAGDTFAGGFIGYLANTDDLSFPNMKKALIYASAMASFCVEKFGTEKLVQLKQEELETRIQSFVELTHFDL